MDRHWGKAGSTAGLYHQTASTLMAILLIPQIIWFLSPLIIERWMGPNDYIDFAALLWLALNTILAASISGFSAFTLASGRNSFCRAHSAIAFLTASLNTILVPEYGIVEAIWGSLVAGSSHHRLVRTQSGRSTPSLTQIEYSTVLLRLSERFTESSIGDPKFQIPA